jgi:hypothetical protein
LRPCLEPRVDDVPTPQRRERERVVEVLDDVADRVHGFAQNASGLKDGCLLSVMLDHLREASLELDFVTTRRRHDEMRLEAALGPAAQLVGALHRDLAQGGGALGYEGASGVDGEGHALGFSKPTNVYEDRAEGYESPLADKRFIDERCGGRVEGVAGDAVGLSRRSLREPRELAEEQKSRVPSTCRRRLSRIERKASRKA